MTATTRIVLIDGPPATGRTRLVQELALQCERSGRDHESWPSTRPGHPLLRSFDASAYPSLEDFASVLEMQWQNFAIRAGTTPHTYLFDGALLQTGLRRLLDQGANVDAVADVALRLLATLSEFEPAVLYLSRRDAPEGADHDWHPWRDCCDAVFAHLTQHRLLLNTSLSTPRESLQDALEFLGWPEHPTTTDAARAQRLPGHYGTDDAELEIAWKDGEPVIHLPGDTTVRSLLPAADGSFLVAGCDLRLALHEAAGAPPGLLLEAGAPHFASLPTWLPRQQIEGKG